MLSTPVWSVVRSFIKRISSANPREMMQNGLLAVIILAVATCNYWIWSMINPPHNAPDWNGVIVGTSFSPYQKGQSPIDGTHPTEEDIDRDLALLSGKVASVRTYSSLNGLDRIPDLAKKYGISVTAGAWLDADKAKNEREINRLVEVVHSSSNIDRVIVGNEAVLRGEITAKELMSYLQKVRDEVNVPVSTAEPWHIWLKNPELARYVDFIAIQVLPYWEGIPADHAVEWTIARHEQIKKAFPGMHVLISEAGWPSAGQKVRQASPGLREEGQFVRDFLNAASRHHLDYFIIEAFDQPWKSGDEGHVGGFWGLYDVDRNPKFPMTGPIHELPLVPAQAAGASLLAALPITLLFRKWKGRFQIRGLVFFALIIQLAVSLAVWNAMIPVNLPLTVTGKVVWGLLIPAQILLTMVILINSFEMGEILWTKALKRRFLPLAVSPNNPDGGEHPMVSIHLAICNEPPDMVIQTLDSLARLDYPSYEVLVIDNNTKDPALWKPVGEYCKKLGSRFRFFHLGSWPGFKAGALNFGLTQTDPRAEIMGIVDSDYIVEPDWLSSLIPYFRDSKVGFVQAPQDHREWEGIPFKEMCNWEYSGFFHIGMVHRNERNAIIQHGTMTLIRKAALDAVGKWAEWCICEDSELGLRLMHQGYEAVYVNHTFGRGVTPDSFDAYKRQRFRWAYGAVQILKKYWRWMVPGATEDGQQSLTIAQKYHFVAGWLPWFADALQLVFTFVSIFWSLGLVLLPKYFEFSPTAFLVPAVVVFSFKLLSSLWLYRAKVPCNLRQLLLAAVSGASLTYTISLAMIKGIFTKSQPFLRTPKCASKPPLVQSIVMARDELVILALLLFSALNVSMAYSLSDAEVMGWIAVLLIQTVPYLAALTGSLVQAIPNLRKDRRVVAAFHMLERKWI